MKKLYRNALLIILICFHNLLVSAQWSSGTLSQIRSGLAATNTGNKAFFAGGQGRVGVWGGGVVSYDRVDIYDSGTNQWTTAQLSAARHSIAAAGIGNLALFAGGASVMTLSYSKVVDIYNTTTNQWSTAQLSQERFYIGAASAGGKILFAGGAVFNNVCSCYINYNTVDVYDATTNQWSVTQLPNLQGSLLATSTANKILFTKNEGGNGLIDIYDVITGQWTTATIPQAQPASAVISVGYKVLFAAGTSFASQIHIYDVVTNQWTTATLSQARRGFAVVNMGSKVFFAGGVSSPSYANSNVVDIYDASTNQWSTTQLPQTAGDLRGTTAGNKVLFADQATGKVDIYTLNDVLPVNLIAFSGKWTENLGAQLNWTTSLETNNDHFQIQRSSDAKTFETIGRVAGKGITKERSDYSFTDAATPDPVNYYRLKQVDLDGSVHFSTIISITRQSDNQSIKLSVWPSPTTGTLTLELTGGKTIQQVGVYDLHGRKLTSQVGAQATADVAGLPTGAYVVEVLTTDGQQLRSRFVKQ